MHRLQWMAAALIIVLSGCGGPREKLCPVVGKVTFQGKPVSAGMIRFGCPELTIDMMAMLGPDGGYEVVRAQGPGLPEGTYKVAVMPQTPDRPIGAMGPPQTVASPEIPHKYRQFSTSGLTFTVKPGRNQFDVDMQP